MIPFRQYWYDLIGPRTGSHASYSNCMSDARPPRSQKPKQPERICGDWKEFRSSSNRVYYWNYRTTVNTWEKPKDWNDEKATVVKKDRNGHRSHQVNGHSRSHHHSRPKTEVWSLRCCQIMSILATTERWKCQKAHGEPQKPVEHADAP